MRKREGERKRGEKSKGENGEFGGSSVRKGKEDGETRLVSRQHSMAAAWRENKFRSSSPSIPITFA